MKHTVFFSLALFMIVVTAHTQVPQLISHQGYLTDNGGQAVNSTVPMTLRLYSTETGGESALTQNYGSVQVSNGVYSVELDVSTVTFTTQYWLEIEVNGEVQIPRTKLTGVPYALGPWKPNGNDVSLSTGNVGIGTTLPSAKLHIGGTAGVDGIKFPDGTVQTTAAIGGGSDWNVSGNTGTTSGTNFMGTTDAQALDIRTDNVLRTRITTKGQIETYNTGQSVFIGEGAGANDDLTNNHNVFVGYQAGYSNTTGTYNTAIGRNALYSNISGPGNTAFGWGALYRNANGSNNTANGNKALYSNTTGQQNTAIGYSSLYFNTTGSVNTAIGSNALLSNTIGYNNSAVGVSALLSNTEGYFNTATGSTALKMNTTGSWNTANGFRALERNTIGENNTAIGSDALAENTEGGSNTACGSNALIRNTTGSSNTASGMSALVSNTEGYSNTALGAAAGYSNITGYGNVFLGAGAGYYETGSNKLYIANSHVPLIYGDFIVGTVAIGTTSPGSSSLLELTSTTKGLVLPRMTKAQREVITSPVEGMMIYQTDNTPGLRVYNGTNWMRFTETAD